MNKTSKKILYGGFAVVAFAGIVDLLLSVFSPPKKTAEETETATPLETEHPTLDSSTTTVALPQIPIPDGYVGYWVDDDGSIVYVTQEELDMASAFDAGRTYTKEEWKQKAKERAEKEWWASRREWIDRFPFESTHHPEITFDPEAYNPNEVRPTNEKDDAYWNMLELVRDHNFLRNFYESKLPYTEEFEQMHDIIKEELGEMANDTIILANDTILQGKVFDRLKKYHHAMTKDPKEVCRKNVQREIRPPMPELLPSMLESLTPEQLAVYRALPGEVRREMTRELRRSRDQEMRKRIEAYHNSFKTVTVDVTWEEEAQKWKESISAELLLHKSEHNEMEEPNMPEEQAIALVDRLLNEIPGEGFLKMEEDVIYSNSYISELKPGDPLLIK